MHGLDRSDAVDKAVMGLGRERPSTTLQPLDHDELPEGPGAIEPLREVVAGPLEEILAGAGAGDSRPADVCGWIESGILEPPRPSEPSGPLLGETLAVAR